MGIDLNGAQLLIRAHKSGVSFEHMATLGHQELHAYRPALISILRKSGYDISDDTVRVLLDPATKYADGFFRLLGAKEIVTIDVSDYEGAQISHDMNLPIPENLASSFDLLLDGGTLEHIFQFPTALQNAARMVKPNGRFISITMANNFCGHGFYQFSPEVFYRFLCPENGYEMEFCIIWEDLHGNRFYKLPDPDSVRSRVEFTSKYGVHMFVMAKRVGNVSLEFIPQQSDFVRMWQTPSGGARSSNRLRELMLIIKRFRIPRSAVGLVLNRRLRIKCNDRERVTPLDDLRVM
jgi:SAM-dependent methyltransferase